MRETTPFGVLGLSPDAGYDATWDAYNELVRQCQASGAAPAEQNQRMGELNWAIDELEARRDLWAQRSQRSSPESDVEAFDYGMDRRGLPTLIYVFVALFVVGAGLLSWTTLLSDEHDTKGPSASLQTNNQLPAGPRTVPLQPTAVAGVPTAAAPSLAPIDVEQVKDDIKRRNQTQATGPLLFASPITTNLTGGSQPDVVIQWPSGGSCGSFTEVWGYRDGKAANLTPPVRQGSGNGFGCGGVDVKDYLNTGRNQLATTARTYDAAQFTGGEYLMRAVWCWTGSEFVTVVAYYENMDGKRLRTENLGPQSRCK